MLSHSFHSNGSLAKMMQITNSCCVVVLLFECQICCKLCWWPLFIFPLPMILRYMNIEIQIKYVLYSFLHSEFDVLVLSSWWSFGWDDIPWEVPPPREKIRWLNLTDGFGIFCFIQLASRSKSYKYNFSTNWAIRRWNATETFICDLRIMDSGNGLIKQMQWMTGSMAVEANLEAFMFCLSMTNICSYKGWLHKALPWMNRKEHQWIPEVRNKAESTNSNNLQVVISNYCT